VDLSTQTPNMGAAWVVAPAPEKVLDSAYSAPREGRRFRQGNEAIRQGRLNAGIPGRLQSRNLRFEFSDALKK
jgi:hypothetical protein